MLPNPTWYPQLYERNTPSVLNNQQPTQTPTVFVNGGQARQVDRIILENNGHSANINEIEARFPGPPQEELRTLANRIEELNQKCNNKWKKYNSQKEKAQRAKEEYEQAKQLLEYDQRNYYSNLEEWKLETCMNFRGKWSKKNGKKNNLGKKPRTIQNIPWKRLILVCIKWFVWPRTTYYLKRIGKIILDG